MADNRTALTRRTLLRGCGIAAAGAALLVPMAPAWAAQDVLLVHNGQARASIVVGPNESLGLRTVATELVTLIRKATGATLPIVESEPRSQEAFIAIGRTTSAAAGVDVSNLGDDGYVIAAVRKGIVLTGSSDLGTIHAVYGLLEHALGFRFLTERETSIPTSRSMTVRSASLNQRSVPRYRFRQPHYGDAATSLFRHHRQFNGRRDRFNEPSPPGMDLWSSYWPEERYMWIDSLVDDPALLQDGNIAFMSPAARDQAEPKIVAFVKDRVARGEAPAVGLIQADRSAWTPDPASAEFIAAHGGANGAAMFDFVNDMAGRVAAQVPGARLEVEAYWWSIQPPTGMTIADNVVITYCPITLNKYVSLFHPLNQQWADLLRQWCTIANHIVLWDYVTDYGDYLTPLPNWFASIQTLQQMASLPQVQGVLALGPHNTKGAEMAPLRLWLYSQALRDPSIDISATADAFLADYYGQAGPHVRTYLDTVMARSAELVDTGGQLTPAAVFDVATAHAADAAMAAAGAAVLGDEELSRRVDIARFNLDHVVFTYASEYLREIADGAVEWDLGLAARKQRCHAAVAASGLSLTREWGGQTVAQLIDGYDTDPPVAAGPPEPLPPEQTPAPAAVAGLPADQWIDLQEEAFTIWPETTTLVADELASNHVAARQQGSAQWGVQCWFDKLPAEGTWQVWFNVRIGETAAAVNSVAVDFGVYPDVFHGALTVAQVSSTEYREIAVPGEYGHGAGACLWVQNTVRDAPVLVDRVFAIRLS